MPTFSEKIAACSPACLLLKAVIDSGNDQKKIYEEIKKVLDSNKMIMPLQKVVSNNTEKSAILVGSGNTGGGLGSMVGQGFKWDPSKCGQGIDITNGGFGVFLKEQAYVFRTVLADTVQLLLFSR